MTDDLYALPLFSPNLACYYDVNQLFLCNQVFLLWCPFSLETGVLVPRSLSPGSGCIQIQVDLGNGGWRKRRYPIDQQIPPHSPCQVFPEADGQLDWDSAVVGVVTTWSLSIILLRNITLFHSFVTKPISGSSCCFSSCAACVVLL